MKNEIKMQLMYTPEEEQKGAFFNEAYKNEKKHSLSRLYFIYLFLFIIH